MGRNEYGGAPQWAGQSEPFVVRKGSGCSVHQSGQIKRIMSDIQFFKTKHKGEWLMVEI